MAKRQMRDMPNNIKADAIEIGAWHRHKEDDPSAVVMFVEVPGLMAHGRPAEVLYIFDTPQGLDAVITGLIDLRRTVWPMSRLMENLS